MASVPPGAAIRPGTLIPGSVVRVGVHTVAIERFLSEGGYAHVYVVRSSKPIPPGSGNLQHVLKRVVVPDKPALQAVRKEVEIMKMLRGHPHIVDFVEATASELPAQKGYEVYILMEFVQGGGIIDMMNTRLQNRLTESEVLKIFSDTVDAVAHMHHQTPPLVHRDLKIENILMHSPACYKLCDFGSTTSAMTQAPSSSADIQMLELDLNKNTTLQYRAPEMCDVWSRRPIGTAADIWALGVFLYKLCFYTTPFEESGLLGIQNASYRMPERPAYSASLRKLIASMLQEPIAARPSANDLQRQYFFCTRQTQTVQRAATVATATRPLPPSPSAKPAELSSILSRAPSLKERGEAAAQPQITPMRRGRPTPAKDGKVAAAASAWPSEETNAAKRSSGDHFGDAFAPPPAAAANGFQAVRPTSPPLPSRPPPEKLPTHVMPAPDVESSSSSDSEDVESRFPDLADLQPEGPRKKPIKLGTSLLSRFTDTPDLSSPTDTVSTLSKGNSHIESAATGPSPSYSSLRKPSPLPTTMFIDEPAPDPPSKVQHAATLPMTRSEEERLAMDRVVPLPPRPELVSRSSQTSPRLLDSLLDEKKAAAAATVGTSQPDLMSASFDEPRQRTSITPVVTSGLSSAALFSLATPNSPDTPYSPVSLPPLTASSLAKQVPHKPLVAGKPASLKSPTSSSMSPPPGGLPTSAPESRSLASAASNRSSVDTSSLSAMLGGITLAASPEPKELSSSSDDDADTGAGGFDLDRALSSIRKFAPAAAPPPEAPAIEAPVAKPASQRKAISSLVSQYESNAKVFQPAPASRSRINSVSSSASGVRSPEMTPPAGTRGPRVLPEIPGKRPAGPKDWPGTDGARRPVDEEPAFDGVNAMKARWERRV